METRRIGIALRVAAIAGIAALIISCFALQIAVTTGTTLALSAMPPAQSQPRAEVEIGETSRTVGLALTPQYDNSGVHMSNPEPVSWFPLNSIYFDDNWYTFDTAADSESSRTVSLALSPLRDSLGDRWLSTEPLSWFPPNKIYFDGAWYTW